MGLIARGYFISYAFVLILELATKLGLFLFWIASWGGCLYWIGSITMGNLEGTGMVR